MVPNPTRNMLPSKNWKNEKEKNNEDGVEATLEECSGADPGDSSHPATVKVAVV